MPSRREILYHVVMILFLFAAGILIDMKKYYFYVVENYGYFAAVLTVILIAIVFALLSRAFGKLHREQISPTDTEAKLNDPRESASAGDRD